MILKNLLFIPLEMECGSRGEVGIWGKENDVLERATWDLGHILYLLQVYV